MAARSKTLQRQLIDAVKRAERSGLTRYRLAKLTGLSEAGLSHFVKGHKIPKTDTADRIADALGYRITLTPKKAT